MTDDLLTAKDVAELFHVSVNSVARWVREGHLRAFRTPGGTLRFRRSDVETVLNTPASEAAS